MKNYLEKKRGFKVRLIIDQNSQKQPVHYYEGILITVGEVILLRDDHLGEVAVNPEMITAVQVLGEPAPSPAVESNDVMR